MAKKRSKKPAAAPVTRVAAGIGAMSVYERIAWVCLHLLVILVPIAISNPSIFGTQSIPWTYDQFDIVKVFVQRALVLVAFGAWLIGIAQDGGRIRWNRTGWIVLVFLVWVSVTTLLSVHPATAIFGKYRRYEGLLSFMTYAAWFFLAMQLVDRESRIRSLGRTLVISGAVVAFYGLLQYLGLDPIQWGSLPFEENRAFSFFGNPDLLGGYLIFPLAISIGMALSEKDDKWRIAYWAMFLLTGFTLLVSFVRGAWIGGTVALLVVIYAAFRTKMKPGKVDIGFIGASGLVAVFAVIRSLGAESAVMNVWERIQSIFRFSEGSAKTRFEIWSAALEAIKTHPVFGWGADTFRLLFPRFKPAEYVADAGYLSVADNVHNYPLQLATAIGIPGVALFYGLFGYSLVKSAPDAFSRDKGPSRLVAVGFWAAVLGYLVHLLFGLSVTGSTIFLWVCLGVIVSPLAKSYEVKPVNWSAVVLVAVLVTAVFGSYGNIRYIAADHAYMEARITTSGIERVEAVEKALSLNPFNDMYVSELGVAWKDVFVSSAAVLTQLDPADAAYEQQYAAVLSNFANAEAAYLAAIEYTPMEYDNYVFIANLYNQASYYLDASYVDDAITAGLLGVQVEQYGPAIRLQLALAYLNAGMYDEAIEHAEFGADLDPNYVEIRVILADAYRYAGRTAEAIEQYTRVLQMDPSRIDVVQTLEALEASASAATTSTE